MRANTDNTNKYQPLTKLSQHKHQVLNFLVLNQRLYLHSPLQINFILIENFPHLIQELKTDTLKTKENCTKDSIKSDPKNKNLQHCRRLRRILLQDQYSNSLRSVKNPTKPSSSPHNQLHRCLYNHHHQLHHWSRLTFSHSSTFQQVQQEVHFKQIATTDRT